MNQSIKKSLSSSKRQLFTIPLIAIASVALYASIHTAYVYAHGGDVSLIHTCIGDNNGRTDIVGVNETCGTNETALDWIKNVFAGTGLTISRGSDGATLSADTSYLQRRVSQSCSVGSAIKAIAADGTVTCETVSTSASVSRYESLGSGISNPANNWVDVPNATITQTFNSGQVKATYTGNIFQQSGDGTAYIRLKVQPTGGTASYVGDMYVYKSSSPSQSENANIPFTVQKLISVSGGEVSITPQVYINNSSWGLTYSSTLIVEQ